jgi:hypothetical protein
MLAKLLAQKPDSNSREREIKLLTPSFLLTPVVASPTCNLTPTIAQRTSSLRYILHPDEWSLILSYSDDG